MERKLEEMLFDDSNVSQIGKQSRRNDYAVTTEKLNENTPLLRKM